MKRLVAFTTSWDDGHPMDVRLAELLRSYGLLGTFYCSSGPGGSRTISDADLGRVARHHELGNHGRTHTSFPFLSSEAIREEVRWGDLDLMRFGAPARIVAPPNGRMNARVVKTLVELGFGVRSAPILGTRSSRATWMEPTLQFYPHRWAGIFRNTTRRGLLPAAPLLRGWVRGGEFRQRSIEIMRVAVARLNHVHVWGHSSEVEALNMWDGLEELFGVVRRLPIRPATNTEVLASIGSDRDAPER